MAQRKRYQVSTLDHGYASSGFKVKLETNKPREAAKAAVRFAKSGKHVKVEGAKGREAMTCGPLQKGRSTRSGRRNNVMTAQCRPAFWFKQLLKGAK